MTDEDRYDDEELAQAQALAAGLERKATHADTAGVRDALDAADLIAASRLPGLSEARVEAVLATVTAQVQARRRRVRRRIALAFGLSGSLAAAAASLVLLTPVYRDAHEPSQVSVAPTAAAGSAPVGGAAVALDAARAELHAAQLAWLDQPGPSTAAKLDALLAQYRAAHLADLRRRYGR